MICVSCTTFKLIYIFTFLHRALFVQLSRKVHVYRYCMSQLLMYDLLITYNDQYVLLSPYFKLHDIDLWIRGKLGKYTHRHWGDQHCMSLFGGSLHVQIQYVADYKQRTSKCNRQKPGLFSSLFKTVQQSTLLGGVTVIITSEASEGHLIMLSNLTNVYNKLLAPAVFRVVFLMERQLP